MQQTQDRHALAQELFAAGQSDAALDALCAEAADRVGPELLNDLGVVALRSRGPALAGSVLRTAELVCPDDDVAANLAALRSERTASFAHRVTQAVIAGALGPELDDNVDPLRHPHGAPGGLPPHVVAAQLADLVSEPGELDRLYATLADDASRDLMVTLFAFRLLGASRVRLPLGMDRQRELVAQATSELRTVEAIADLGFMGWSADRYDLSPIGCDVVIDAHLLNILTTYQLEQYTCPEHPQAHVRPGDTVIDGGGCWGDTALWFADRVGPDGHVHCFEFEPGNVKKLQANLELNPALRDRIVLDQRALWGVDGEQLAIASNGPGTTVGRGGDLLVPSATIDGLVADGRVEHVDFVKLDIEGAELGALHGARETLLRDRPRLAIALYHKPEDWTTIPRFLADLGVGYRCSLGHFTVHAEETVLFAWTE